MIVLVIIEENIRIQDLLHEEDVHHFAEEVALQEAEDTDHHQ